MLKKIARDLSGMWRNRGNNQARHCILRETIPENGRIQKHRKLEEEKRISVRNVAGTVKECRKSMGHARATQPNPRICKVQPTEIMHCSATSTEQWGALLVTGCVHLGRALSGAGKEEVHIELARWLCTRGMPPCTDSGSGDACRNPCAGICTNELSL